MNSVKGSKELVIRFGLVLLAIYLGTIVGAALYGGPPSVHDIVELLNPILVVATIGFETMTPYAQIFLAIGLVLSICFVSIRKLPYWSVVILFGCFAALSYFVRFMWKS